MNSSTLGFDESSPHPNPPPHAGEGWGGGEHGIKGRWRVCEYDELVARENGVSVKANLGVAEVKARSAGRNYKASLDIFWLKDESLAGQGRHRGQHDHADPRPAEAGFVGDHVTEDRESDAGDSHDGHAQRELEPRQ